MTDIATLLQYVQPEITKIDKTITADLEELGSDFDDLLVEVLNYGILGGGKRIRPLLTVLAARLCGKDHPDVYQLAIAFEYLHLATLIHDDVIDNADNRRGKPSVVKKFGLTPAILAGDFLHARSMAIVGEIGGRVALDIFCRATAGMVDGEFVQLRNAKIFNQSEGDYFHAILGKTALLIGATTEIGALFAEGSNEERQALKEYGIKLGCGFQIVDDLLDYLGDEKKTGKKVGNDLVEGKMTLPLIATVAAASPADRKRLLHILESDARREDDFVEVKKLITTYNGFQYTSLKAKEQVDKAIQDLTIFTRPETDREKVILQGLAHYVLNRDK